MKDIQHTDDSTAKQARELLHQFEVYQVRFWSWPTALVQQNMKYATASVSSEEWPGSAWSVPLTGASPELGELSDAQRFCEMLLFCACVLKPQSFLMGYCPKRV